MEAEGGDLACMAALVTTLARSGQLCSAELGNRLNLLSVAFTRGLIWWFVLGKCHPG